MDEHAERVCQPLIDAWGDFKRGQATLLDLSRLAEHAWAAIDNANMPLPQLLPRAVADLEHAYYASERAEHDEAARRILAAFFAAMDHQP